MALWVNRSGRNCEHISKFLDERHIYRTWDQPNSDHSRLRSRNDLIRLLEQTHPNAAVGRRRQSSRHISFGQHKGLLIGFRRSLLSL